MPYGISFHIGTKSAPAGFRRTVYGSLPDTPVIVEQQLTLTGGALADGLVLYRAPRIGDMPRFDLAGSGYLVVNGVSYDAASTVLSLVVDGQIVHPSMDYVGGLIEQPLQAFVGALPGPVIARAKAQAGFFRGRYVRPVDFYTIQGEFPEDDEQLQVLLRRSWQ